MLKWKQKNQSETTLEELKELVNQLIRVNIQEDSRNTQHVVCEVGERGVEGSGEARGAAGKDCAREVG